MSARSTIIARNYLRLDPLETRLAPVLSIDPGKPRGGYEVDTNHPPLSFVLIALGWKALGSKVWSARLVPILFSLGSAILIYAITSLLFDRRTGLFSLLFAVLSPMSIYYSRMVLHEEPAIFFLLLVVYLYLKWSKTIEWLPYVWMFLAMVCGSLCEWSFYLILPAILLVQLVYGPKKGTGRLAFMITTCILIFFAYLIYNRWVTGITGLRIAQRELFYLHHPCLFPSYLLFALSGLVFYFTPVLTFLTFLWLGRFISRRSPGRGDVIVALLLLEGLAKILILATTSAYHVYYINLFLPGLCMASARALRILEDRLPGLSRLAVPTVMALFLFQAMATTAHLYLEDAPALFEKRDAGAVIAKHIGPDDTVLLSYDMNAFADWAFSRNGKSFLDPRIDYYVSGRVGEVRPGIVDLERLGNALEQPGRRGMYFFFSKHMIGESPKRLLEHLRYSYITLFENSDFSFFSMDESPDPVGEVPDVGILLDEKGLKRIDSIRAFCLRLLRDRRIFPIPDQEVISSKASYFHSQAFRKYGISIE
ncbi:ArnT family glycosyltransferase [Thermodesulfobacteriota bacterium]